MLGSQNGPVTFKTNVLDKLYFSTVRKGVIESFNDCGYSITQIVLLHYSKVDKH